MAFTTDQLADLAKTVAAVGGVVGAVWALISRWLKRRRKAREKAEMEARATRYLLDAVRHALGALSPHDRPYVLDPKELERQKILIDGIRDDLWVADGHRSEREAQRELKGVMDVITRTQAIRVKKDRLTGALSWTEKPPEVPRE